MTVRFGVSVPVGESRETSHRKWVAALEEVDRAGTLGVAVEGSVVTRTQALGRVNRAPFLRGAT